MATRMIVNPEVVRASIDALRGAGEQVVEARSTLATNLGAMRQGWPDEVGEHYAEMIQKKVDLLQDWIADIDTVASYLGDVLQRVEKYEQVKLGTR